MTFNRRLAWQSTHIHIHTADTTPEVRGLIEERDTLEKVVSAKAKERDRLLKTEPDKARALNREIDALYERADNIAMKIRRLDQTVSLRTWGRLGRE